MKRRTPLRVLKLVCAISTTLGCTGPIFRPQSPELAETREPNVALIGDLTRSEGMTYTKIEAVSLVTGLKGTGSDPPPSPQRAAMLDEMQRRNVDHPARILASADTALVLVRGYLRPGIQKGDHFDVEVQVPSRSETTSLRNGWLMPTRLTELAVLDQRIRKGHLLAMAEGPVLVDPASDGDERRARVVRGRVLGRGTVLESRPLGLTIHSEHLSARVSQRIGAAVNQRFHKYIKGVKRGVASPKTDQYVRVVAHPRYKDNVARFMRVVRNIAYRETLLQRQQRMDLLERQLLDPVTAPKAAIRLEAIGLDAVEILRRGMQSSDPEVRFYAAEALAYLDDADAVAPLAVAARHEPAFRVHALAARSADRSGRFWASTGVGTATM